MLQLNTENLPALMDWLLDPAAPRPLDIQPHREQVATWYFNQLFLRLLPLVLDEAKVRAFETLIRDQFHRSPVCTVRYACPYPKYDFLRYLVQTGRYLLHGSGQHDIDHLEPRAQTDWNDRPIVAVFATSDGIWPLFFALVDRSRFSQGGSIRNACFVVDQSPQASERFYFFSVNEAVLAPGVWQEGIVYVLARATFAPTSQGPVRFDEWASQKEVAIVAKLPVAPEDFPFLAQVTGHPEQESIFETWLQFKQRQQRTELDRD